MTLTRRGFLERGAGVAALLGAGPAWLRAAEPAAGGRRPNVLMLAVDDLRPELGCYGHPMVRSPNLDRLAARGILFERAYCQQAVCGPTRASLLTGLRPDTTRVYDLQTHIRATLPDCVTLPQHFKNCGYHSEGMGKLFHSGLEDDASYSVPHRYAKAPGYHLPENLATVERRRAEARAQGLDKRAVTRRAHGPATECADVADDAYGDGVLAGMAVEALGRLAPAARAADPAARRPFFLGVGFARPHLPFVSPKRYWDLYEREKIALPFGERPKGAPPYALPDWGELRAYSDIPAKGDLDEAKTRELIHGYYAAVSYLDAQVGRVLAELERLGLAEDTVVVVWGDHGWKLGEYRAWCKHTNVELDVRVPLLLAGPGVPKGARTKALVEYVDLYPTLAGLAGLPAPARTEGTDLVPLLADPARAWKSAAFSQYPRTHERRRLMGYTMRTERHRYTEWQDRETREVVARELYDLTADPRAIENLAADPAHAALVADLHARMNAGWTAARPVL